MRPGVRMRRVARGFGWVAAVLAGMLVMFGVMTWPPGGLMFALPFVFLMPGALLGLVATALFWLGREPAANHDKPP